MKNIIVGSFIIVMVVMMVKETFAFNYVDYTSYNLCWYTKYDSNICRDINNIKQSIVKYGNSKKPWSQSEAEKIQDNWFLLQKNPSYSNVIVKYTFNSTGDPNFVRDPWLAGGTPV